jgi:hypothetical protein
VTSVPSVKAVELKSGSFEAARWFLQTPISMSLQPKLFTQSPNGHFVAYDQPLDQGQTLRLLVAAKSAPNLLLNWGQVVYLWQNDSDFRNLMAIALAQAPFTAFFWETPPIAQSKLLQPWECVIVNAPALVDTVVDLHSFAEQFARQVPETKICLFPNLGGDALLVVPCLAGSPSIYPHFATFVRNAPYLQVDALWKSLGNAISRHLEKADDSPLWVSTSGLGVSWLHIRLDSSPKYYTYLPYRHSL